MARNNEQREMYSLIDVAHHNLEQSIKSCYATSLSLALTISDDGIPQDFEAVAADLLQSNSVINAVELVPNGVIKYVYPTIGNEKAIGFDILKSREHREEALRSLRDGKIYFAGPLKLQQGGSGIVGRMPVFVNGKFWGFSAVLIKPETLFRMAGITSVDESKYSFQLVKNNPVTGENQYFLPGADDYKQHYYVSKAIPDGGWELVLSSRNNYSSLWAILPTVFFGFSFALLFGFVITLLLEKPAKAVRESEARFESLFNDSPIALWEEDFSEVKEYIKSIGMFGRDKETVEVYFRTHPEEIHKCLELVRIINVNNECLRLHYPKTREELLSHNLNSIMDSDTYEDFIKQLQAVAAGQYQVTMDTRMIDGRGGFRDLFLQWTVMRGCEDSLDRVIVATEDITKRKNAEKLISDSQQRLKSLINTIDGVVWESNFESDNISFVNAKAEEIMGYPMEQWLSEPNFWTNHIHPDDREEALRTYFANVHTKQQFEFEYRFLKKDETVIWVKDYVNVVSENGKPAYVRGITIDVTKTKEADHKLNESLKLVIEQNKRLQNFSYIVSHNLRSHTSNIQSIAALMETVESERERQQMTGMLRTVSASLNETMTNLNEVVNIQTNISLVSEKLNLRHYIESAVAVLSEQIALKGADISIDVPRWAEIVFNPAYLESILLNLISNAIRYSSTERQPKIHILWIENAEGKTLSVSDNGIGIDLDKYGDKLFGMYKTFSNNPDSRGIGLFITKNQIEAMGGSISVESEPHKGTTFTVRFK
ncbi:PAS domain-containing protein [Flavobacterium sp. MAH-1]|uniref:histidine kinase n=1 Tax=Flavobacterium agri TaxID=2743471 RepID=A0A7Y8XZN8_9FLAO|nr:PAS domain-containing protein [Flavobacterium agri]NUY79859.1 PAS domain-containing protein [Flavobacterium agri]NYA69884.1 PAS domain-containing protein [Flavobacterium agri]